MSERLADNRAIGIMREWLVRNRTMVILAAVVIVALYTYYFIDQVRSVAVLGFAWTYATPLVLAALVGVLGERSGVINIGIEGQMLVAAFTGFFVAAATGSNVIGVLAGIGSGLLLGGFLGIAAVSWRMDQIIAGVVLNVVATGITSFYYVQGKSLPNVTPNFTIPILSDIPLLGPVFFSDGPIGLLTLVIVLAVHFALFKTRWGLRTRAVGEYPSAADTAGINVARLRIINVTLAGALAGCAGAYLSMEATQSFARDMTSGRGFLALAIMIFGAWRPLRAFAAALFFGFMTSLASQLQYDKVVNVPQQLIGALPYVLTLVVLAVAAGRVRPPAASGKPFVKGDGS